MKLRIKGNSIRLRLTQSEVSHFGKEGHVYDQLTLNSKIPHAFTYGLETVENTGLDVKYRHNKIIVFVPKAMAEQWTQTDQVGIEQEIVHEEDERILVLVEKDFQCMHNRPHEDESDQYKNPLMQPSTQ